jgi:ABC-type branched-subunit amino acid transport system ATPase component
VSTAYLRARGVRKSYGALPVLTSFDLEAQAGEIVGLIGPNGAGKSTALAALTGGIAVDAGHVECSGIRIDGSRGSTAARHGLVVRTFQQTRIVPHLSLAENVELGAHRFGELGPVGALTHHFGRRLRRERAATAAAAEEAMRMLGIADQVQAGPESASSGLLQLVQIARAIAARPKVLLLDEPTAGLDHTAAQAVCTTVESLAASGMAVILVEHDMQVVRDVCTKVCLLSGGEIAVTGPVAEVEKDERARAAFAGQEAAWI